MMYGRMNSQLGVEIPFTTITTQTTIPYYYVDPPTEIFNNSVKGTLIGSLGDGTQIWKITHNGVDTHAVHWHMFNVQVINRVGWDGAIRPPDANEVGWKDTVRMNPLEDIIVAMRPIKPNVPWELPNSIRPLDPTHALNTAVSPISQFTNVDPAGQPATVLNHLVNYGNEYVWHCHLLGHEEFDMMRAMAVGIAPNNSTNLAVTMHTGSANLTWVDSSVSETNWTVQRTTNTTTIPWATIAFLESTTGPQKGATIKYNDTTILPGTKYYYQVLASNWVGDNVTYTAPGVIGYPYEIVNSTPSNV